MIGIGIVLAILGAALTFWQQEAVWMLLRGVIPLTLIIVGIITFLIGYSKVKARRFYRKNAAKDAADDGKT